MIILRSGGRVRGRPSTNWPPNESQGRLFTAATRPDSCPGHAYAEWIAGDLSAHACEICGLLTPGETDPFQPHD